MRKTVVLILIAGVLLAAYGYAQTTKRTRTASITAASMEFDWDKNVAEFTGNTKLVVGGDYDATMTAPKMTARLSPKADSIVSLVAAGPVKFVVVTRAGSGGVRRKITASATKEATYSEDTQVVKLVGNAVADMAPINAPDTVEAMHFAGQTIVANLKTSRLTVDDANLTVKTVVE